MKEEKKSEFSSKMEEIAKQATALVEKDSKKSVIIIATESDDDGTAATIAIAGRGGELARAISEFATNDGSKELLVAGLKLAQTKMMFQSIEKVMGGGGYSQSVQKLIFKPSK
jgi:hypothetical protein